MCSVNPLLHRRRRLCAKFAILYHVCPEDTCFLPGLHLALVGGSRTLQSLRRCRRPTAPCLQLLPLPQLPQLLLLLLLLLTSWPS